MNEAITGRLISNRDHLMNKHISTISALPALVMFLLLTACGGGGGGGSSSTGGDAGGNGPSLGDGASLGGSSPSVNKVEQPIPADSNVSSGAKSTTSTVTWLPPTQNVDDTAFTDLVGYKIYIGSEPGRFEIVRDLKEPGLTEYVLEGLPAGTYYVGMTAVNSQNIESPLSNVVKRTVGGS